MGRRWRPVFGPPRVRLAVLALAVCLFARLWVAAPVVRAQGSPDQVNDPPATTTYSCGGGGTLMRQSFTPGLPAVTAVDLHFRAGARSRRADCSCGCVFWPLMEPSAPSGQRMWQVLWLPGPRCWRTSRWCRRCPTRASG